MNCVFQLLKAVGYDDRRRIRAQIRLVKKQIEEDKNFGQTTKSTTRVTTTTTTTYTTGNIPSVKDIKVSSIVIIWYYQDHSVLLYELYELYLPTEFCKASLG